jgi:DNA-directed RNA polymerase subunit RPC12/RpoP
MVTFCSKCGTSLPYADIIIRDGDESIANYYKCPECKQLANPPSEDAEERPDFELDEDSEMVVRQGECATQPASSDETTEQPADESPPEASENVEGEQ